MKYIIHYNIDYHKFILNPLLKREDIIFIELPVKINPFLKILVKIDHKLELNKVPALRYRTSAIKKLKEAKPNDEIILFNITYPMDIAWIYQISRQHKLHVWTWNPIEHSYSIKYNKLKRKNIQFYTFDEHDAKTYHMTKLPQVFRPLNRYSTIPSLDYIFIGQDKNRVRLLDKLTCHLENYGYNGQVKIIGTSSVTPTSKIIKINCPPISYSEMIEYERSAKVIIDIVQPGQTGATLRVMEAIFLGKKIITNNKSLINEKWYHPSNVFILDDNYNLLPSFIKAEYQPITPSLFQHHDVSRWIDNFRN